MVLGGAIVAGLGFGAGYYLSPPADLSGVEAALSAERSQRQSERAALSKRLDVLEGADLDYVDPATLEAAIGASEARQAATLSDANTALNGQLSTLEARLTQAEKRPVAQAGGAAIAAYERELQTMREALALQRQQIEDLAAQAEARISGAEAQAQDLQASMAQKAQATLARAALGRIEAALNNDSPFEGALADLSAADVRPIPEVLQASAATGIPSLRTLQKAFPEAARAALAASRTTSEQDTTADRMGVFLRTQLGVRSLTPQEGDDPDAVLSRAEAAVSKGDIPQTLAEILTLPEAGQTAMADWVGQAQLRLSALKAAGQLRKQIDQE